MHVSHSGRDSRRPVFAELLDGQETTVGDLTAAYPTAIEQVLDPSRPLQRSFPNSQGITESELTDDPVETQQRKLDELGWTDLFDETIVTGALHTETRRASVYNVGGGARRTAGATVYVGTIRRTIS